MESVSATQSKRWSRMVPLAAATLLTASIAILLLMTILSPALTLAGDPQHDMSYEYHVGTNSDLSRAQGRATIPISGLVAYYPFNGNANDGSGNGYDGTVEGATLTTDRFGSPNSAYSFDGMDDCVAIDNTSTLDFLSGGFTLAAWVSFSHNDNNTVIGKHDCGSLNGYFLAIENNAVSFHVSGGSNLQTTETYNDGNWHLIIGVYDDVNQYIYVDSVSRASQPVSHYIPNDLDISIGRSREYCAYFNGVIDDVRIYDRPLSEVEIQALYYEGFSGPVLIPPAQVGFSEAGLTVSYTVELLNLTGATDSFTLTVQPGNNWTTTLSLTQTGTLSDGANLPFTVWVEVSPSASPGDMDAAMIQATSVTSPTVFSDTAIISTTVIGDLAYVGVANHDYLALVDTAAHIVVGTIDLDPAECDFPWRVAIPPDGETVWVSCRNSGYVIVVDRDSNTVVTTVDGLWSPAGIGFTHDGTYALVGSRDNSQVVVIDTSTYSQTTIETAGPPSSIAVHPYLPLAYGTDRDGGSIAVIDTVAMSLIETIDAGNGSRFAAISRDGQRLYVSSLGDNSVSVIDTLTDREIAVIDDLEGPRDLAISPDGGELYVNTDWNAVQVIDTSTFSVERTITVDPTGNFERPWGADLTCDGGQLLVTNPRNDWSLDGRHIAMIDTASYTTTALLPMPDTNGDSYPDGGARGIAVCPQYVATGVFISPPAQTNQGGRSQVVAHQGRLINATGASDSFNLALGSHVWDTALSTDSLGPIANGDLTTFTVYVTVPVGVDWYLTDTAVVTATSVASPTVYSDTATFTAQAYAPPEIGVSSDVLTSTQFVGEVVSKPLTISNGSGVTLTFEVIEPGAMPVQKGLVGYYPFNGNANDESGNGNHGIVQGATFTEDRFGNPDSATSFDGFDDYIEMQSPLTLSEFAFSLWIKTQMSESINNDVIYTIDDGTGHYYALQGNSGGALSVVVDGDEVNEFDWTFEPDAWTHIVVTFDGLNIKLYKDGVLTETGAISGLPITGILMIGDPQSTWNGEIDDIRIYNRVLSETEIQELYDWQGNGEVPWLSTTPISGTVTTNDSMPTQVTFDSTSMQPDTYAADLIIQSNDPFTPSVSVPTTMTVLPTSNMGWVEGIVTDGRTGDPLEATIVALGQPYTVTTDPDTGAYIIWLDEGNYTIQVTADGYVSDTAVVDITAQQGITRDFDLVQNVPVLEVTPDSLGVTHDVGNVSVRTLTITNDGPAPLEFEIGSGPGVSFFATSTELYGYDVPDAWLRIIGTEDSTHVRVIDLDTGGVIAENSALSRYEVWDVYPDDGTPYKIEADKPVVGYETDLDGHDTFVPSLNSGPVGREFIFYYDRDDYEPAAWYVFAMESASVKVYDTSDSLVDSQTLSAGEYWDLSLSNGVYHVVSTGRIAIQSAINDAYTTVPSTEGDGVGRRFYFATYGLDWHPAALAVFAYQDTDVNVYDLDSGALPYSQHIDQGNYWWQTDVGTRRLRLQSTGKVEVWAGSTQDGSGIENLGDDLSFAGGDSAREYYLHSLMDGSVIFGLFDNTQVDVDGIVYELNKDEYLHLDGCCYFRHIQSNQPILIQTLGRDSWWDNLGTYLGGVLVGGGGLPPWLSADPITGTVSTYNSRPVQVTFDATGIQPGDYAVDLVVRSNDPITPTAYVSATMAVLPTADMGRVTGAVSDAWTDQPLEVTVELVGVHSLTASPDYTIWATAGTYSLKAYAPGYYTATRSVTIVAGDVVVVDLALEPAESRVELPLDTISAAAGAGWKSTQGMVISNTGPLPLDFAFHEISPTVALQSPSVSPADLAGKRILYDRAHGEPETWEYSSLISDAISAGAVVDEITHTINAVALEGYDVLWVNCCGNGWTFSELSAVSDWLSQGGAVLVHGETNDVTNDPAGIFGITYQWGSCPSGTTTNIADHPISEGVSAVSVQGTCSYLSSTLGADIVVRDPDGQSHVVAQEQNGGKMVVVASQIFRDWQIDLDDNRLLANNTLAWLARPAYTDVPWLSETPQAGTIPGHSSLPVDLEFDATSLSVGEYQAVLAMEHNDPAQASPIELPVTLNVFQPIIGLTVTKQARPDPVQAGEQLTYTIRVTNTGNMELHATITDTLPAGVTEGRTSGGTLVLPGGVVTWTTVIPASGLIWTETIVVTAAMDYTGPLTNVVKVATVEGATGIYTETSTVEAGFTYVYLPIVLRNFP